MSKITVLKTVYWNDGFQERSGKVKQLLEGHAVIKCAGSEYIVETSKLSLKPLTKTAKIEPPIIIILSKNRS